MQLMCGTQSDRTSPRSPPLGRWQSRLAGWCVRLDGRLDVVEAAIVTYELSPMTVIHQLPMPATEQPIAVNTLTQAGLLTAWVVTDRPSPHSTARMLVRSVRPVRLPAICAISRHISSASQNRWKMEMNWARMNYGYMRSFCSNTHISLALTYVIQVAVVLFIAMLLICFVF